MGRWAPALCLVGVLVAACAGDDSERGAAVARPDIRRTLEYVREEGAPGVVALVRNRSGTWRAATGLAAIQPRRAMRPGERFRAASVTKTFIATLTLQLAGEGRLRLDDTIEHRLPGLLRQGRRITIRQLLNHTSGLYNFTDDERFRARFVRDIRFVLPPRQEVAIAASRPLGFNPGTDWAYSNTGYQLLGLVIERVSGQPLGDVLAERIFEPLRLRRTSFEPRPRLAEPIAHGYALPGGDLPVAGDRPRDVTQSAGGGAWAAGAIVSTVDDLARFYGALLGGKLLRDDLLHQLQQTVSVDSPVRLGLGGSGLGIFQRPLTCGSAWGHDGAFPGYLTQLLASKDGSHIVVMAANGDSSAVYRALFASAQNAYCTS
jgi:D-alanyl-D-alanine carboxypeptidase